MDMVPGMYQNMKEFESEYPKSRMLTRLCNTLLGKSSIDQTMLNWYVARRDAGVTKRELVHKVEWVEYE